MAARSRSRHCPKRSPNSAAASWKAARGADLFRLRRPASQPVEVIHRFAGGRQGGGGLLGAVELHEKWAPSATASRHARERSLELGRDVPLVSPVAGPAFGQLEERPRPAAP